MSLFLALLPRLAGLSAGVLAAFIGGTVLAAAQFGASGTGVLSLRATYGDRGGEIGNDITWRVFAIRGGNPELVTKSQLARPSLVLPSGHYMVHVSHGLATATREFNVGETGAVSTVPVNAGALMVSGYLGVPERPIPPQRQKLTVYIPSANNSEAKLVTTSFKPFTKLHLPEGTYHLVSTYSGSNSVVRTDVKVETGKVTEAVVNHRAATMTLKLVRQKGGVALAGAEWTIETPGGDIVSEAVGAFPSVDIGEGTYTVTARHNDREYKGQMKVEGGVNRDFEIVVE